MMQALRIAQKSDGCGFTEINSARRSVAYLRLLSRGKSNCIITCNIAGGDNAGKKNIPCVGILCFPPLMDKGIAYRCPLGQHIPDQFSHLHYAI